MTKNGTRDMQTLTMIPTTRHRRLGRRPCTFTISDGLLGDAGCVGGLSRARNHSVKVRHKVNLSPILRCRMNRYCIRALATIVYITGSFSDVAA